MEYAVTSTMVSTVNHVSTGSSISVTDADACKGSSTFTSSGSRRSSSYPLWLGRLVLSDPRGASAYLGFCKADGVRCSRKQTKINSSGMPPNSRRKK